MWKVTFRVTKPDTPYELIAAGARLAVKDTGYSELMSAHLKAGRLLYRTAVNLDGAHVVYTIWQNLEDRMQLTNSPEGKLFHANLAAAGFTHETTYEDLG